MRLVNTNNVNDFVEGKEFNARGFFKYYFSFAQLTHVQILILIFDWSGTITTITFFLILTVCTLKSRKLMFKQIV